MQPGAFVTAAGVAVTAVSADEMRAVDRVAVEDVGIDLLSMMENAGRNLAMRAMEHDPRAATVVAGNGGNGGGGMSCARHLANHGVSVHVVIDRPPTQLSGAAARQHRILDAMGIEIGVGPSQLRPTALVIDALVGYGLDGPLRGTTAALVDALDDADATVLSLDAPSGLDATIGEVPGRAIRADEVVTLALPKIGLTGFEGRLFLADIGIPQVVYDRVGIDYVPPFGSAYLVSITPASGSESTA